MEAEEVLVASEGWPDSKQQTPGAAPLLQVQVVTPSDRRQKDRRHSGRSGLSWTLLVADWAAALCIMSPLCTLFWRGTWQILDSYLLTSRPLHSAYVSAAIGYSLTCACNLVQRPLTRFVVSGRSRHHLAAVLVSRLYIAIFAFGLVNHWRGVWQLLDQYFGKSWMSGGGSAGLGIVLLAAMRALRNVMAPPLSLVTDHLDKEFAFSPTLFRTAQVGGCFRFVMDVAFSVAVVGSLVVFVWRGLWTVLDDVLMPNQPATSGWYSLALGYSLVLLAYATQFQAASLSRRLKPTAVRVLFEDVFVLVASVGAINVWRGGWLLADAYIFPDDYVLSNWVTSIVGLVGSIMLYAGNTILARGVFLDGELKDGTGCIFANQYLRKFIKQNKQQVASEMQSVVSEPTVTGFGENKCNSATKKANGRVWKIARDEEEAKSESDVTLSDKNEKLPAEQPTESTQAVANDKETHF